MKEHGVSRPIGVLYEHPEWFIPLFAELDRRGLPYEQIAAHEHSYDPSQRSVPYSLVVNRVSPSSYLRGHTSAIFHARQYLAFLEDLHVPVVNGSRAYGLELSKAQQLTLLARLGLPHPRSRVVNHPGQVEAAASTLEYPLMIKPNIGGSGALMRRFNTHEELHMAAEDGELESMFGLDYTAIVQEYHPPKDSSIVRVEGLDDRYLYAIRIYNDPNEGFNLCPADICRVPGEASGMVASAQHSGNITVSSRDEAPVDFAFCPVPAPAKKARRIEAETPPMWIVDAVLRIFREAGIDVGGVEYLESERDGQIYLYDINALSNFVTDAPTLVGFDPFVRFVDYLEHRAGVAVATR